MLHWSTFLKVSIHNIVDSRNFQDWWVHLAADVGVGLVRCKVYVVRIMFALYFAFFSLPSLHANSFHIALKWWCERDSCTGARAGLIVFVLMEGVWPLNSTPQTITIYCYYYYYAKWITPRRRHYCFIVSRYTQLLVCLCIRPPSMNPPNRV